MSLLRAPAETARRGAELAGRGIAGDDLRVGDRRCSVLVGGGLHLGRGDGRGVGRREAEEELAALAEALAARMNGSAVQLDQPSGEREADALPALGAIERRLDLPEHLEDPAEVFLGDADAGVPHAHGDLVAFAPRAQGNRAVSRRVLRRIDQDVGKDLGEADQVAVEKHLLVRNRHHELVPGRVDHRLRDLDRVLDDRGQLEALDAKRELRPRQPRDVEQILEQTGHLVGLPAHDAVAPGDARIRRRDVAKDVDGVADRRERIAQLVRERREELVLAPVRDEKGLLAPDVELPEAQLAQFIFMPGFSTATELSEISGRGVGMDVVKSELTSLGTDVIVHAWSSSEGLSAALGALAPLAALMEGEISTLDGRAEYEGMPFMPEMLKFCGARMMSKSARTRPAIQRLASVVARWPTQCICRTSAATARRMMAARPGA